MQSKLSAFFKPTRKRKRPAAPTHKRKRRKKARKSAAPKPKKPAAPKPKKPTAAATIVHKDSPQLRVEAPRAHARVVVKVVKQQARPIRLPKVAPRIRPAVALGVPTLPEDPVECDLLPLGADSIVHIASDLMKPS